MNYQATCALISYIFKSAFRIEPRPTVSDVVSRPQLYNSSQIDCLIGSLVVNYNLPTLHTILKEYSSAD